MSAPTLRDLLAEAMSQHRVNYHTRNVGGDTASELRYTSCDGCDWLGGWHDEAGWEGRMADALLASPALDALVAERVADGVVAEVVAERQRQDAKWGEQNHPDGTGAVWDFCSGQHDGWAQEAADDARRRCQEAHDRPWGDTYALILNEEVAEAFAEDDPARLRAELIQVAAVAVAWVEAIDRRAAALTERRPT